ncbi:HTTM domain-containing protein [Streptomyces sp. NBC_01637]|uniref:HTTM domain-containing protein n=1 Tax=unclassified Streptomyces TaxID=2593676 RepID=UPI00386C8F2A|nr:HTTM domain-containing protein [Streptomyces sp. NBC_01653]WTD88551.1 HTTM domain-containing protein [Streptomyces sp. NBC_01637]
MEQSVRRHHDRLFGGAVVDRQGGGLQVTAYSPATSGRESVPPPRARLWRRIGAIIERGFTRITSGVIAPYQSAVIRIGFSLTWLALLLREWVHRNQLYGADSPWSWTMAREWNATNHGFTILLWHDGRLWFEIVYLAAIAASVMLLLGWRTRTASLLFMIGVLALQNRNPFVGNGGDNVIHIMAIYMVFTRCGQVWSLDARRSADGRDDGRDGGRDGGRDVVGIVMWAFFTAVLTLVTGLGKLSTGWALLLWGFVLAQMAWWLVRSYAPGEPRTVMGMVGNVVHAGAMLVIAIQVCLIYSSSGWYKIQGSLWQDGTAIYYALHLGNVTPWPALSHAVAGSSLIVLLLSYGTVIVEVAFPFTLFNSRVRTVMVAIMMSMHLGIGILLGLPFFTMAMIAADSLFLPTAVLRWLSDRMARAVQWTRAAVPTPLVAQEQTEPVRRT